MTTLKICKGCGHTFPENRDFFGNTPSGGFRGKCRSCMRAYTKQYELRNQENVKKRAEDRRIRTILSGGKYTLSQVHALRKIQKDLCAYCCAPLFGGGQVDHVVPVAKGGTNETENLVIACMQCNKEKHAKTGKEYLIWRVKRGLPVPKKSYAYKILVSQGAA